MLRYRRSDYFCIPIGCRFFLGFVTKLLKEISSKKLEFYEEIRDLQNMKSKTKLLLYN